MKLFILTCAYADDRGAINLATPEVYQTREDALKALEDEYHRLEPEFSETMDSDLDLDLGTADIYTNNDGYSTYQISEVEVA